MAEQEDQVQEEIHEEAVELKVHIVRRSFRNGKWIEKSFEREETLEVKGFVTTPAAMRLGRSLTVNLGNFESARSNVEVLVPCYREELVDAAEFARALAKATMDEEMRLLYSGGFDREEPPKGHTQTPPKGDDNPF